MRSFFFLVRRAVGEPGPVHELNRPRFDIIEKVRTSRDRLGVRRYSLLQPVSDTTKVPFSSLSGSCEKRETE